MWRTAETRDPAPVPNEPAPEEGARGLEVHPNPFRGAATVALTLPEAGEVDALPVGVYVVRVAAGGAMASERLTLVR